MAKILIVEDSDVMEQIVQFNLLALGHEVVGRAEDGQEAFEKYKEFKPDLVLMDLMMPRVSGKEGIKLIKQFDPSAKIVVCSAILNAEKKVELKKFGIEHFLVKPYELKELINLINKILENSFI